jgi:hypothetical protein
MAATSIERIVSLPFAVQPILSAGDDKRMANSSLATRRRLA